MKPLYEIFRQTFGYKFPPLGKRANETFFKLIPKEIESHLFPSIRAPLNLNDLTQRTTYWQGDRFEYPTSRVLLEWASKGATHFFDIGANYGFFSYFMLSHCKDIQVHAFEPNPSTFGLIERIKSWNQLTNFHPENMGLSNTVESLVLHSGNEDSGHSTFGAHPDLSGNATNHIRVQPFDFWCKSAGLSIPPAPRWIAKIDVEGFEVKVLNGMLESLRAHAFIGLVIEINPFTLKLCNTNAEAIYSILDSAGYKPATLKYNAGTSGNEFFTLRS